MDFLILLKLGSLYTDMRSLSSVALRKMLSDGIPYHFDYFTLDLNNELSGVYGPLLYDQLEYANSSLYRILELYKQNRNKPKSVVVIGHSMTTTIPRAWVETNHVQILWCKQVVLAINRALFDIVSVRKKQITNNTLYRDMVFHHHLVDNSGINIRYWKSYQEVIQINTKVNG
nr:unnamed protein product [Callosobruchus chinensis]